MSSQNNSSKKNAVITASCVAVWVIILAAVKHYMEHALGIAGCWTFTAIILFFALMPGEINERIKNTMCGAVTGIVAGIFIYAASPLFTALLGHLWSSMVPIAICIFVIIVGHNFAPAFCNDTAFGYMILSTMKGQEALMQHLPSHFILLIIGGLIAIYGTILIKKNVSEALEKRSQNNAAANQTPKAS